MAQFIVYQGYAEKFTWRQVEEDGITPIHQCPDFFDTQDEAVAAIKQIDSKPDIELKPIAHFDETPEEAIAREAKEAEENK